MRNYKLEFITSLLLSLVTLSVFWEAFNNGFVNYDDTQYVTKNFRVKSGFTLDNVVWAFSSTKLTGNWHPLTWLSHMADCHFYGLNPKGHHSTSIILHTANTVLIFLVFNRITSSYWKSLFVSLLFGIHPIHVESVAWVSERKDVLSTFFWILTIGMYSHYVKTRRLYAYLICLLFYSIGLMAKPMLVTLPFVLILLDYWPLNRMKLDTQFFRSSIQNNPSSPYPKVSILYHSVVEKIPLFFLSFASILITFVAQKNGNTVASLDSLSLIDRLSNALISYVTYLWKMVWPKNLAAFYPLDLNSLDSWKVTLACLILVLITFLVIYYSSQYSYLAVGWFWYLGTLVPVIGLLQVGEQSMADRYAYIPSIGVFFIIAWMIPDILKGWKYKNHFMSSLSVCIMAYCIYFTLQQIQYWKNSLTLFVHATEVTENNYKAHFNAGLFLSKQGKTDRAVYHFNKAIEAKPNYANPYNSLGIVKLKAGKFNDAVNLFSISTKIKPYFFDPLHNMAIAQKKLGNIPKAIQAYHKIADIKPYDPDVFFELGMLLSKNKNYDESINKILYAIKLKPAYINNANDLGISLIQKGRTKEAIRLWTELLNVDENFSEVRKNLKLAISILN